MAVKKSGEEKDTSVIDGDLMAYAHHQAEYYNECVGAYQPETNEAPTVELDKVLYDLVVREPSLEREKNVVDCTIHRP